MNDKFWEADKKLREALDNQDTDAATHWADVYEYELTQYRAEEREEYIRIHGKPPFVSYCTTMADGPTWEVSEEEAVKKYGYKLPGDEAESYQRRIKANPLE